MQRLTGCMMDWLTDLLVGWQSAFAASIQMSHNLSYLIDIPTVEPPTQRKTDRRCVEFEMSLCKQRRTRVSALAVCYWTVLLGVFENHFPIICYTSITITDKHMLWREDWTAVCTSKQWNYVKVQYNWCCVTGTTVLGVCKCVILTSQTHTILNLIFDYKFLLWNMQFIQSCDFSLIFFFLTCQVVILYKIQVQRI